MAVVGGLCAALALSAPAAAHAAYASSVPAFAAVLDSSPAAIELRFTQELFRREGANTLTLARSVQSSVERSGSTVALGEIAIDNADRSLMRAAVLAPLQPGRYLVSWQNLSADDGDADSGSYPFYVGRAASAAEEAADRELAAALLIAYPGDEAAAPAAEEEAAVQRAPTVLRREAESSGGLAIGAAVWLALGALAFAAAAGGWLLRRSAGGPLLGLLLTVLFTVLAAAACGGGPNRPDALPVPGTAAFTLGVDLWLREDGEERLIVAAGEGRQVLSPALSPDGRRIAFVRFQLTNAEDISVGSDLVVYNAAGGLETVLAHDERAEYFWNPRWSADGRSLVYTREAPGMEIAVEQIDLSSGAITVLRRRARDGDISADGSRLVFVDDPYGGALRLLVRELASGREYALDAAAAWPILVFRIPRWSPDGQSVFFAGSTELSAVSSRALLRSNGPEDIWRVDAGGGAPQLIAPLTEDQPDFALSSDGRHLLARGSFGVYLAAVAPGAQSSAPFAIAPGEFHGWHDWRGVVSDAQWSELLERGGAGAP